MMSTFRSRSLGAVALAATTALLLAGCAPGAANGAGTQNKPTKTITSDKITLTVATDTPAEVTMAVAKLFEKAHPNITVKVDATGYESFVAGEPLLLASNHSPDLALINGVANMAKDHLLRPLNDYAKLYGWDKSISTTSLAPNSVESDLVTLGGDTLVALPLTYYEVGVYYNKKLAAAAGITKPPTTLDELNDDLAKAKAAGELPIQFGNQQGHASFTIQEVAQAISGAKVANNWIFGKKHQTFDTAANRTGVQTMIDWNDKGYFPPVTQINGTNLAGAVSNFVAGQGVFFIDGNWDSTTIAKGMGDNAGFFVFPGQHTVAAGGSTSYAISAKAKHPNEAAAFLDFFASSASAKAIYDNGVLPNDVSSLHPAEGTLNADLISAFRTVIDSDGLSNAYANASPSMNTTFTQQTQELLAGKTDLEGLLTAVQADWTAAHGS